MRERSRISMLHGDEQTLEVSRELMAQSCQRLHIVRIESARTNRSSGLFVYYSTDIPLWISSIARTTSAVVHCNVCVTHGFSSNQFVITTWFNVCYILFRQYVHHKTDWCDYRGMQISFVWGDGNVVTQFWMWLDESWFFLYQCLSLSLIAAFRRPRCNA